MCQQQQQPQRCHGQEFSSGGRESSCVEEEGGVGSYGYEAVCRPTTNNNGKHHPRPQLPVPYIRLGMKLELASGTPAFTNFTPEFTETLDYVFIEGGKGRILTRSPNVGFASGSEERVGLKQEPRVLELDGREAGVGGVAPMPEGEALRALTPGLPTETFPSDHVSLVLDLELSA